MKHAKVLIINIICCAILLGCSANMDMRDSEENEPSKDYIAEEEVLLEGVAPDKGIMVSSSTKGVYHISGEGSKMLCFTSLSDVRDDKTLYSFDDNEIPLSIDSSSDGITAVAETLSGIGSEGFISRLLVFKNDNSSPLVLNLSEGTENSVVKVFTLSDGRIAVFFLNSDLVFYSQDGIKLKSIDMNELKPGIIVAGEKGKILVQCNSSVGNVINEYSADYDLLWSSPKEEIYLGGYNAMYYRKADSVFRYEPEAERDTIVFSYTDIGVIGENVRYFTDEGDSFLIGCAEGDDIRFFSVKCEDTVGLDESSRQKDDDRTVIGFAGVNVQAYQGAIVGYNNTNTDYRISIDYSVVFDSSFSMSTIDKYHAYILSEKPEIFEIYNQYEGLAKNGYMMDINPYLENSESIKAEDYVETAIKDNMIDGKLYTIPKTMRLSTVAIPEEALDKDSWNIWEYLEFLESHADAFSYDNKSQVVIKKQILLTALLNALDEFIKSDEGDVFFEDKALKEYLDRINAINIPVISRTEKERLNDGDVVIVELDIFNTEEYSDYEYECGRSMKLIGFPSSEAGVSGSLIGYANCLAIADGSANPDEAWKFIEYYQSTPLGVYSSGFPTKKADFEKSVIKGIDRETVTIDGIEYGPVTRKETDAIKQAFERTFTNNDPELIQIIMDEAEAFFSGDKTLDETCMIIRSRVQLYINESIN